MAGVEFVKYTPGKTMRVKITSPTRVRGQHFSEGKIVELSEADAYALLVAHKAERYVESAKDK